MVSVSLDDLAGCFGLGVAGNFAGHLEQAGEAADFVDVAAGTEAPKGVFPWYVPGDDGFLGEFPLSSSVLELPVSDGPLNLQIEPEAGVVCSVFYEEGEVARLVPVMVGAFNDCSIRRPGARKISEKKNWGACSKGFASSCFSVSEISPDGATASFRLASFLRHGDEVFEYGVDSPVAGYSYYGDQLVDWIVDRLRSQRGGDTPLEDVGELLRGCGQPAQILIGIGATRYTDFGESNFLETGDESIVILYDSAVHEPASINRSVVDGTEATLGAASVLVQVVRPANGS